MIFRSETNLGPKNVKKCCAQNNVWAITNIGSKKFFIKNYSTNTSFVGAAVTTNSVVTAIGLKFKSTYQQKIARHTRPGRSGASFSMIVKG